MRGKDSDKSKLDFYKKRVVKTLQTRYSNTSEGK